MLKDGGACSSGSNERNEHQKGRSSRRWRSKESTWCLCSCTCTRRISFVFPPPHAPRAGPSICQARMRSHGKAAEIGIQFERRGGADGASTERLQESLGRGCAAQVGQCSAECRPQELGRRLLLTSRAGWAAASGSAGASGVWDTSTPLLPETRTAYVRAAGHLPSVKHRPMCGACVQIRITTQQAGNEPRQRWPRRG